MKPFMPEEIKQIVKGEMRTPLGRELITQISTDSRQLKPGALFVALKGDRFDGHDHIDQAVERGAVAVLVDRKVPLSDTVKAKGTSVLQVKDTLAALGDLARAYRRSLAHSIDVIAVTGSNGKTTTREMIYHVLSKQRRGHRSPASFNNAIGVPLTLLGMEPDHDFVVVEMGTNAPGEIAALSHLAEPDIAVITSVGPSHLEGLKDVDGVSREKISIVAGLRENGVMVCPTDHVLTLERVRALGRHYITFGLESEAQVNAQGIEQRFGQVRFETNDRCEVVLPIAGVHNVRNALAALAAVRRLGVSSQQFAEAIRDFEPVGGRLIYKEVNGITILDDSYNANPASMAAALAELVSHRGRAGRLMVVIGDMCELGSACEHYHAELGRQLAAAKLDMLFTVGDMAALAGNAAIESGMARGSVQRAINSRRLARLIKASIRDEDVIVVKGSRAMQMEKVVQSLERYRGGRKRVVRVGKIRSLPSAAPQGVYQAEWS